MKENTLFKLDLLQSYYLQKPARFGVTKQMLRSEKYQTKKYSQTSSIRAEKQKHKLLQLSRNDAFEMIKKLQHEAFEKKLHAIETALHRALNSALKKEKLKVTQKLHNLSNGRDEKKDGKIDGKREDELKSQLETITLLLSCDSATLHDNVKYKIIKLIIQTYPTHFDVKNDVFEGIPENVISYVKSMKENNPYKTNTVEINNVLSKVYADKKVKSALESVHGLEIIWGPKKQAEKNEAELKSYSDDEEYKGTRDEGSVPESDGEDDEEITGDNADGDQDGKMDDDAYEKLYESYKDYMVGSSDEEEGEGEFQPDPNINYNEITDEEDEAESSDDNAEEPEDSFKDTAKRSLEDDDFFASDSNTTKKARPGMKDIQLPTLATGYYSGGESDDENTNDSLVEKLTKPRKNRRGQRARQKIWEKKYGSSAKHVLKQHERAKSDRERLRLEFEARQAKRERKQAEREEREKAKAEKVKKQQEKTMHPSWEAKIKAQESMKKAKFEGKKITFD